ncbi:MAG: serine/threonine protein kinase [Myxococcales bacterium]|nr:serine/threonine protein kinase [Myxococcales bacterium]
MVTSAESTAPTTRGEADPGPGDAGLGRARRLGRYTLLEILGHGGMGVVFAAYDEELDRKVAVKFVQHADVDPRARAMLLGEAQALARLAHPNVIHVYEVGVADERIFIAMEFVRGQTLRRWLAEPRAWPEVVAMLLQAGRGLAAAHQAGVVHCDFKPDNALVGADGRLRVLDFGLAHRQADPAAAPTEPVLEASLPRGGTPGYMPPERHEQRPVDARSDQFSFCVALYEALHGARPFAGETPAARMLAVLRGEVRPLDSKLPARLRRAVLRGLAVDPAARWPSMPALLAELEASLPRSRGRWWLAAAASALVTSAGWALLLRDDDRAAACAAAVAAERDALWGPEPRAAAAAAFTATGLPYAADSLARADRLLAARVDAWADVGRQTCVLPDDHPARRCLAEHRRGLAAWIDALRRADATAVEHAVAATAELPDPRACQDPAAALADERDVDAADVDDLLAEARALERAGQYDRALAPARAALERARARGLHRREAAVLLRLGLLQERTGAGDDAGDSLAAAYFAAESAGHRGVRAEAAIHLVHVSGGPPRPPAADALWLRLAESIAAGLGDGALDLRAALLQHRGRAAIARGDLDAARADLADALALETRRLGDGHPALAAIHEELGDALLLAGRDDEALAHHERAITVAEVTLGPDHPSTARRVLARGQVHERRGELEAALRDDLRALAVWQQAYGEHPRLIWPLTCAGRVLRRAGRLAEAEPHYARARAIAERTLGPDHPDVARALVEHGDVLRALGRLDEALALHRRALAILTATGADAVTWSDLAAALHADGAPEEAARARP